MWDVILICGSSFKMIRVYGTSSLVRQLDADLFGQKCGPRSSYDIRGPGPQKLGNFRPRPLIPGSGTKAILLDAAALRDELKGAALPVYASPIGVKRETDRKDQSLEDRLEISCSDRRYQTKTLPAQHQDHQPGIPLRDSFRRSQAAWPRGSQSRLRRALRRREYHEGSARWVRIAIHFDC